jgi:hypothetical protein
VNKSECSVPQSGAACIGSRCGIAQSRRGVARSGCIVAQSGCGVDQSDCGVGMLSPAIMCCIRLLSCVVYRLKENTYILFYSILFCGVAQSG